VDAETVKTLVSLVAAAVAVVSAVLAHRAKIQTRRDLFDAERNALILAMVDNDTRCEHIALQEAFARSELLRIEPRLVSPVAMDEHAEWLQRLPNAAELGSGLKLRQYTPESLDALEYTELNLTALRKMTRGEQVNAKQLAPASYDLIFAAIGAFVAKHDQ
jgi:Na+-transporting NADH:ubiquinone oxidoreductase subunit NqrC